MLNPLSSYLFDIAKYIFDLVAIIILVSFFIAFVETINHMKNGTRPK